MLVDLTVKEFIEVLGSDAPAPGGGSASALAASMGISLTKMVSELTIGKKKYAEFEAEITQLREKAVGLQGDLLEAIDKDTEAFNQVSEAFSLPRVSDEDKRERQDAIQKALKVAAETPLEMMAVILEAIKETEKAVGKSNTNAASDLGVAALSLKTGLQGAWLNVLINVASIIDEDFVAQYKERGQAIVDEGAAIADRIYEQVLTEL